MNPKYFAIIELKYITKSKYEEKGQDIVIEQLNKYKLSEELKNIKNLKKWAVIFVNDKCLANVEV